MILTSPDNNSIVKIEKGELVSYIQNNEELIHQKGEPGWGNSDTEMFPIVGPTSKNNFKVATPKGIAVQDQHGLLRELEYNLLKTNENNATLEKNYIKNTLIKNSKFPDKSTAEQVYWPYDFTFKKIYNLDNESLKISFEINSKKGMPFMLGYHPAFKLSGNGSEICKTKKHSTTIQNIMDSGSSAYPILETDEIILIKEDGLNVAIKTKGFNNFMCWTEVTNLLCIEPITKYPYTKEKELSPNLFNISKGSEIFNVEIKPF